MQQQAPDNDVNNFQNERVDRENNLKEESTESSSEVDNVNETSHWVPDNSARGQIGPRVVGP
jgi:hypothetical protein